MIKLVHNISYCTAFVTHLVKVMVPYATWHTPTVHIVVTPTQSGV